MKYIVLDPHPKVIQKWLDNGDLPDPINVPLTEQRFFVQCANAKKKKITNPADDNDKRELIVEAEEDPTRPIERKIIRMYRLQNGDKEYVYWVESLRGQKFSGPYFDHSRIVGKYEEPFFDISKDRESGSTTVVGIHHKEVRYEIPFADKITDAGTGQEIRLEELAKYKTDTCKFMVRTANDKAFEVRGISFDDWKNKSFSELVEIGKMQRAPVAQSAQAEAPRRRVKTE